MVGMGVPDNTGSNPNGGGKNGTSTTGATAVNAPAPAVNSAVKQLNVTASISKTSTNKELVKPVNSGQFRKKPTFAQHIRIDIDTVNDTEPSSKN